MKLLEFIDVLDEGYTERLMPGFLSSLEWS